MECYFCPWLPLCRDYRKVTSRKMAWYHSMLVVACCCDVNNEKLKKMLDGILCHKQMFANLMQGGHDVLCFCILHTLIMYDQWQIGL